LATSALPVCVHVTSSRDAGTGSPVSLEQDACADALALEDREALEDVEPLEDNGTLEESCDFGAVASPSLSADDEQAVSATIANRAKTDAADLATGPPLWS
jgi:hypothetical protein